MRTICLLVLCILAAGCGRFGQVNQGRTVAFDRTAGTVMIVDDSGALHTVRLPQDPREMGPAPEAGGLVRLDRARGVAVVFHAGALQEIPVRFTGAKTFEVQESYRALPAGTWKFGDEIRYYYKDPGQALRLMNVTKTDLTKGK